MLADPYNREKLLDLLRAPDGYELDEAIGTTYSLDLPALLVAPLAFTLFEIEDANGQMRLDSLEVVESLRRFSNKLTVFCQAGRILTPAARFPQFVHLERVIVECLPPNGGSFHPKVWILRFSGPTVVYRLLCLSRNLTFDLSWDTALVLEGEVTKRQRPYSRNAPLSEFLRTLPSFASRPLPLEITQRVERIAGEVGWVDFVCPEGVDDLRFLPLGIPRHNALPLGKADRRLLVMSPFLSGGEVKKLFAGRSRGVVISTTLALCELEGCPGGVEQVLTIADAAAPEPATAEDEGAVLERPQSDLHAKLFVIDEGRHARVLTGSANATHSGLHRNVEFMIELTGSRKRFGIEALLSRQEKETRFRDLLREVSDLNALVHDVDPLQVENQRHVDEAWANLVRAPLRFLCTHSPDDTNAFDLILTCDETWEAPQGVEVACWPVTLSESAALPLRGNALPVFPHLTSVALTRFLNLAVSAGSGQARCSTRFVLTLPLDEAPADREERVLRSMLGSRSKVVEYLLLLLADETPGSTTIQFTHETTARAGGSSPFEGMPLLETMLRALDRDPRRLDQVHRLVTELQNSEEGASLLPKDFDSMWKPIWAARLKQQAVAP